jgi:putative transposase
MNRRKDLAHKTARRLADTYGVIVVENLSVDKMRRSAKGTLAEPGKNVAQKRGLNRSISEQGWSQLIGFLEYKVEETGAQVIKIHPAYTSQMCSECGMIDARSRKGERFCCVACGHTADADVNAARNILARGLGHSLRTSTVG